MRLPAVRRPLACLLLLLLTAGVARADGADRRERNEQLQERIAMLIEALGSDQYATRERAQSELAQLGTVAFDDLLVARSHRDVEIAQRAEYLIERMKLTLLQPEDSPEVRRILGDYEDSNQSDRLARIARLALLDDWEGVEALCRLVRFDDADAVSKRAALEIMQQDRPDTPEGRERLAQRIESAIHFSRRPSADWALAYADLLRDPNGSLAAWEQIVDREWGEYQREPREQERQVLLDLVRWQVDLLREVERPDEAEAAMVRSLTLVEATAHKVLEAIDWFMDREAWPLIEQTYERFEETCQQSAIFRYRLAEVRLIQGRDGEAEQLASEALAVEPENLRMHGLLALQLRRRGLFEWAEREYRYSIEQSQEGSVEDFRSRLLLAEMLHDQHRDLQAGQVLQPAVEALRTREAMAALQGLGRQPGDVIARMHYFYALHYAETEDREKQAEHLDIAVTNNSLEPDVLIALYQLAQEDESRRERTMEYIQVASGRLLSQMSMWEDRFQREEIASRSERYQIELASLYNQYAWLVANTEGDYVHALECSQQSLEYFPESGGFLDTLAHCHFALGDYEAAVRTQRRAIELEPHSGIMQQKLADFEQALREQQDGS